MECVCKVFMLNNLMDSYFIYLFVDFIKCWSYSIITHTANMGQ